MPNLNTLLIRHRWLWHLGFWGLYAASRAVPYYATIMYYDVKYLEFMSMSELTLATLVYGTLWLYSRFCTEKYYKIYFIVAILTWIGYVAGLVTFQKFYLQNIPEIAEADWLDIFPNALSKYLGLFSFLTMAKYIKDNYIRQYYESEQQRLQVQTELQNLKAQISPHFLFNTMNNFYGLAVDQSKKLPELMVRLSELLRYSLYETNYATVPLSKEIRYLKNYIELEKIRLEDNLAFTFNTQIAENDSSEIAPLLLVVFIENAFKHAKNIRSGEVKININLSLSTEKVLLFEVGNNCLSDEIETDHTQSGIGLSNVKKRLEVLYPNGQHELTVKKERDYFQIRLRINLQAGK